MGRNAGLRLSRNGRATIETFNCNLQMQQRLLDGLHVLTKLQEKDSTMPNLSHTGTIAASMDRMGNYLTTCEKLVFPTYEAPHYCMNISGKARWRIPQIFSNWMVPDGKKYL